MKTGLTTLLYIFYVLNTEMTYSQDVDRMAIVKLSYAIVDQINSEQPDFQRIAAEIEKLTAAEPVLYTDRMRYIVATLQNKEYDENATALAKDLIEKAVFLSIDKSKLSAPEILEIRDHQLQTLLTPQYRSCKTDILNDCDPDLRYTYANRLLNLYQSAVRQIDDRFDLNARENQMVTNGFVPPATYKQRYYSGQDMSNVEDEATREAYKKYCEEQRQKANKRAEQTKARDIQKHLREPIQNYLIDAYTLFPYRTAELEKMLTDKKVDSEMAKTILDAIRKAEKEHPNDSFRIWLSKDKMLKTEAKFIFYDAKIKEATLEREDGKRMSIEWSALRKEDQEYIRRQIELDQEKLKD